MATYREIQEDVSQRHGRYVKTCWIADVKASHGMTRGVAPNRISPNRRKHPCPAPMRPLIEDSMRHLGML